MAFKMRSPLRNDPPTDPKPLFDPFTRTRRQVPGAEKFLKKQKENYGMFKFNSRIYFRL